MSLKLDEHGLWMAWNAAPGIGPVRFNQILKGFRSLDAALGAGAEGLAQRIPRLGPDQAAEIIKAVEAFDAVKEREWIERLNVRVLRLVDPEYPPSLLPLPAPPPLLYVRGKLPQAGRRAVAVVGTRTPTAYGLKECRRLVQGLAAAGLEIVSGLARGIDSAAHEAALDFGTPTFAALGSGLAVLYPPENKGLADRMLGEGGGLVSQFSMLAPPDKRRFPMRNGIISGLSSGVLVVEGQEDSGSLITARWALEHGREVYALPGPADSVFSRGPNLLIQEGAKLILGAEDVLEEFPEYAGQSSRRPKPESGGLFPRRREDLSGEEARIFQALAEGGRCSLEQLSVLSGLEPGSLKATLTMLEIKGAVRQLPGALVELL
jgi:DNA processing protein